MATKDKMKKPKVQLPLSIINYYKKYRNTSPSLKTQIIMGSRFDIDERYEIIDIIGQGAYGIVVACKDHKSADSENKLVAIKKIEKAFEHRIFAKRTLRELKILRNLRHENIISIYTILLPKSREDFEDMFSSYFSGEFKFMIFGDFYRYCVSELMETDLASIIKSPQPLTDEHCQFFLYQILRGLKGVHSAKILHRDLKPRNLLVNSNCDLKICDFGLARANIPDLKSLTGVMTDYVATRWYRAPELLLSWKEYTAAVDVWSVGCIFAELLKRKPFLPGGDTKNQIELIIELFGTPSEEEINSVPKEKSRKLLRKFPKRKGKNLEQIFSHASPLAIDLLKKLMTFDPSKRITVEEALRHPYLQALHSEDDEPIGNQVDLLEFEFENYDLTLEQLKDLIYEEILYYHFKDFRENYENKKKEKQSVIAHVVKNENSKIVDEDSGDEYDSEEDF